MIAALLATVAGASNSRTEARRAFRRAAERGNAFDPFRLRRMYKKGQGGPRDCADAAKWLRRAAGQGHAGARNIFGAEYEHGKGVPHDFLQA